VSFTARVIAGLVAGLAVGMGVDTIPDMFRTLANVTAGSPPAASSLGRRGLAGPEP
jgi:Na+/H+-dicarboxylate symporter